MPKLTVYKNNQQVLQFPLPKRPLQLGRSPENDIVLSGEEISRCHIKIDPSDDGWTLTDLSGRGVKVNEKRQETCPLQDGDRVTLGSYEILIHLSPPETSAKTTHPLSQEPTQVVTYCEEKRQVHIEKAKLHIVSGVDAGKTIPMKKELLNIGKHSSNELVLNDPYVSQFHASISLSGNEFLLKDRGSTNGTQLNGERIENTPLSVEDEVTIGKTVIRFETTTQEIPVLPARKNQLLGMVGRSDSMREVYSLIEKVAPTAASICLLGETGTGKEVAARVIHSLSPREKNPFIAINCGAVSPELIESELFGHEKGAFTGAHQRRKGTFEQAHTGTIFLDEIGELPPPLQPKLLRVLETREFLRVGGEKPVSVDVRIITATNRNLQKLLREGTFREDLFFRLYVVPIFLPPLRDRSDDISLLVKHFLKEKVDSSTLSQAPPVSRSALDRLKHYSWPGNVRELKNVLDRSLILSSGDKIDLEHVHFPSEFGEPMSGKDQALYPLPQGSLEEIEKASIIQTLKRQGWNKKATAMALGIAKSTLHEKIKKYGITKEVQED